jgi:hypothetical protein
MKMARRYVLKRQASDVSAATQRAMISAPRRAIADDRRKIVREDAVPGGRIADVAAHRLREVADRLSALTLSEQIEL